MNLKAIYSKIGGAYSGGLQHPLPPPPAAKFTSQGDIQMRSSVQIKFLYYLLYIAIFPTCKKEYIGESRIGNSKLRDRVRIYRQHIQQPEHENLKVEKDLKTCDKGNFTIFLFLQFHSNDMDLQWEFEDYFIKKYKAKLNSL